MAHRAAYFNYGCNLTQNARHIKLHLAMFTRVNNVFIQFPIDATEDLCDYLKYENRFRTPVLYEAEIKKLLTGSGRSNVLRCSFTAGEYYYVRDLLIYQKNLGRNYAVMPTGDYRLRIELIDESKEIVTNITVFYQIYSIACRKPLNKRNRTKSIIVSGN